MRPRDVSRALVEIGFTKDGSSRTYRRGGLSANMSAWTLHMSGDGASVVMDLDDIRMIRLEGRLMRIIVRGGHHSFLM